LVYVVTVGRTPEANLKKSCIQEVFFRQRCKASIRVSFLDKHHLGVVRLEDLKGQAQQLELRLEQ